MTLDFALVRCRINPASVNPQAPSATHMKTAEIGLRNGSSNTRIRFCVQTVYMPKGKTAAQ